MNAYTSLAQAYDRLTWDVDYAGILDYIEALLRERGKRPETVLDLACGTGSLSVLLARRGYRVTGVDMSEDMLAVASEKACALEENVPFFVCQRMERLRLPECVELVVCCLDSMNYITDPAACRRALRRVYDALAPGGMFIFDVNTPEKLRAMDGQVFLDETEDIYCVWRGAYDSAARVCAYGIDLFLREGRLWRRCFEEHREYAYTRQELERWLGEAGFTGIRVCGDRRMDVPAPGEQRIYFSACKE